MEPQMRKLRFLLKEQLRIKYVMGGLIRDWDQFSDQLNNISRPSQMGPLWMEAKHVTGQPIDEFLWVENPVDSSYLACMAVKAAEKQNSIAGEAMLRELREGVMIHRKNIGEKEVVLGIAELLEQRKIIDLSLFEDSWMSREAADLFRKDLEQVKIKSVSRFPTLLISNGQRTVQITGYRPFSVLLDAFKALEPELEIEDAINREHYEESWMHLTERELQEIEPEKTPRKKESV